MAARRLHSAPHHPRSAAQARPDVLQPPRDHQVPQGPALGLLHPTLHGQADGQAPAVRRPQDARGQIGNSGHPGDGFDGL
ncbi:hypothetical protein Pyn_01021 [Prunus yedoensis var. nudiflora]|nr:hypothetical protein Pyn_01021 [Prunus yedoensis var. nudiflora]